MLFTQDCPAIIIDTPNGRFVFVGRVPEGLHNKVFDTIDEAKIAAVDVMIATGQTFPVDVLDSLKGAA